MRNSRRYGVRTLAAAGLIGAAMLAPAMASAATMAPATPGNCTMWTSGQDAFAKCTSGTGQYRIHAWCVKVDDPSQHYTQNGAWVSVPQTSSTGCPSETYIVPKSIQTR